ncbi:aspartate dehydrogenase [Paenibacillus naphthalenovorans]|uniref:aspartate dehydrogenase n=1 Tax=Paenibacillus naphthalenovorans TaxID=162209 RepID=UPI003D2CD2C0
MLKVGIIGYGTIGEDVAEAIGQGKAGAAKVAAILVRDKSKYGETDQFSYAMTEDEAQFFAQRPNVVVECAGHEAVRKYGELTLEQGSDLIVVSAGAFADEQLFNRIMEKAEACSRKVIVPSAAIGGLDRIAAGSVGKIDEVTLITRKPPKAWYGTFIEEQVDLAGLTEPYKAFEGAARDSARLFPESVNVSAALSLAGIGFDETKVKVIVDPTVMHNTHEIVASGKFGRIQLQIQNTPSVRNPKTGYIVAMSVIKTLRDRTSSFIIGI